jgi:Domain of unknown function (DUF1995)
MRCCAANRSRCIAQVLQQCSLRTVRARSRNWHVQCATNVYMLQVLPDSLLDSILQAAEATSEACSTGCARASVEILLPEYWDPISGAVFADEGDQMRWWKLCKRFADDLIARMQPDNVTVVRHLRSRAHNWYISAHVHAVLPTTVTHRGCASHHKVFQAHSACGGGAQQLQAPKCGTVHVIQIFPDIGVAAYLQNSWPDPAFTLKSLNDKKPVTGEEDLVIVASPDPTGAQDCVRVSKLVPSFVPMVLFNPRLVSGAPLL